MINTEQKEDAWDYELKGRERLFVLRYCTDSETFLNATATYRKVYSKADKNGKVKLLAREVCEAASSRLMKKDRIRTACSRLLRETQADIDQTSQYQLLHDMVLYATYNPADIINSQGELKVKDLKSIGELAKCVTEIFPTKFGYRVKLADRGQYIQQLLKYLELVKPDVPTDDEHLKVIEMVSKAVSVEEWNRFAEESEAPNGIR